MLLATAAMSLVVDLVLYGLAAAGHTTAIEALLALGHLVGQRTGTRPMLALLSGIALYVALQLLWALVYAHVERWLPRTPAHVLLLERRAP